MRRGEFLFSARTGTAFSLTDGAVDPKSLLYKDLKAKHFIYDDASSPLLDILAAKVGMSTTTSATERNSTFSSSPYVVSIRVTTARFRVRLPSRVKFLI